MALRKGISGRPEFLHAAAGAGGHAACHLCGLEDAWHEGRAGGRAALRAAGRLCGAGAHHALRGLRPCAAGRCAVLRRQGGGAGHRHRGAAARGTARAEDTGRLGDRGAGLPRPLLLRHSLPHRHHCGGALRLLPRQRRCGGTSRNASLLAAACGHRDHLGRDLARAAGSAGAVPRSAPCADRGGCVFLHPRRRYLRRGLCGALLHGAGGGGDAGLALRARDDRRAGAGGDDAGAADPRHAVCGLLRGLPRVGLRLGRHRGGGGDAVDDLCAVLPVDLRRCALYRSDRQEAHGSQARWRQSRRRWWA